MASKTPRVGDNFTYDGQSYKVTKVPSFSMVCGENIKFESGQPSKVKVPIREIQLFTQ